jgi:hypothetical protein
MKPQPFGTGILIERVTYWKGCYFLSDLELQMHGWSFTCPEDEYIDGGKFN